MRFATPAARAKYLAKKFGKSYYFATRFFPPNLREATYALYAFFRLPDDVVDAAFADGKHAQKELLRWQELWKSVLEGRDVPQSTTREASEDIKLLRHIARVFEQYEIPRRYSFEFLAAMLQDCKKKTYRTYTELKEYMYGSAAVVGLMMTHVIGFSNKKALSHAKALGEAMQLTNFLRDVGEDWRLRQRIYLPLEDLRKFGVSKNNIVSETITPEFVRLMKYEIARARALYAKAEAGIEYLSPAGRLAVRIASALYAGILDEIEQQEYDVFRKRAKTTLIRKISLAVPAAVRSIRMKG